MILEIIFFPFINAINVHEPLYINNHQMEISSDQIFCSSADLILNPDNFNFICYNKHANNTYFSFKDELNTTFFISLMINITNNTNANNFNYNLCQIIESLKVTEKTKLVFNEFFNLDVVDSVADTYSPKNLNLWLTMDWMRYSDEYSHYCQWDKTTIDKKIYDYFEAIIKTDSRWKKICLNNQAYLHYSDELEGEIIIIPKFTFVICFCAILALIIFIIITLYIVAKCCSPIHNKRSIYPEDNSDNLYYLENNNNNNNNNNNYNNKNNNDNNQEEEEYDDSYYPTTPNYNQDDSLQEDDDPSSNVVLVKM